MNEFRIICSVIESEFCELKEYFDKKDEKYLAYFEHYIDLRLKTIMSELCDNYPNYFPYKFFTSEKDGTIEDYSSDEFDRLIRKHNLIKEAVHKKNSDRTWLDEKVLEFHHYERMSNEFVGLDL